MPAPMILDVSRLAVENPVMTRDQIAEILPHRGTMALLDGICHLDTGKQDVAGWKDVKADEFWADGHFPGNPLLPGVIIVEAAAQACLVCYRSACPEIAGKLVVFGGLNNVRFRGAVRPGDRLFLLARMTESSRRGARSHTQAVVNGRIVFEGEVFAVAT